MDLKLEAEPTFKTKVGIPVPGRGDVDVEFTFKWRSKDEWKAFLEQAKDMEDVKYVMEVAIAWQLNDAFTPENIAKLLQKYQGAAHAIAVTYTRELIGARLKN